jgi:phosphoribosylaminoimidazole-succinocarboxamide synthase
MDFLKPRYVPMNRRRRVYEGKAKILFEGPEPGTLVQFFKDDATAFNKKKHEIVDGKGVLNNRISEHIFVHLNRMGIPTHFIKRLNMREQLIREVEIIPLEVVVRNIAAGSLATRLGIEEGTVLPVRALPRRRHPARRFQDRVRAALGKRHDADRRRRRDFAG